MANLRKFKKFTAGAFVQYSYSPKHLNQLTQYDRRPLLLFTGYDNVNNLIGGFNMHWLTKTQRTRVIQIIKDAMKIEDSFPFGKPMNIDLYKLIKAKYPIATIAFRKYFPNRIRNIKFPAWQWEEEDLKKEVINTDTEKIIGTSPELIQKLAIKAAKERQRQKKLRGKRKKK